MQLIVARIRNCSRVTAIVVRIGIILRELGLHRVNLYMFPVCGLMIQ